MIEAKVKEFYEEDLGNLIRMGFRYFVAYRPQDNPYIDSCLEFYTLVPLKKKKEADRLVSFMGESNCILHPIKTDLEFLIEASSGILEARFLIPEYENDSHTQSTEDMGSEHLY